jgi:hypothetical protein
MPKNKKAASAAAFVLGWKPNGRVQTPVVLPVVLVAVLVVATAQTSAAAGRAVPVIFVLSYAKARIAIDLVKRTGRQNDGRTVETAFFIPD